MIQGMHQCARWLCTLTLLVAQEATHASAQPRAVEPAREPAAASGVGLAPAVVSISAVSIPKDTKIELMPLESISSGTAVAGSPVRFAVAKDVMVDGVIAIRAGAPVTGIVTKVRPGVPIVNGLN
jgi:hypothetical protein